MSNLPYVELVEDTYGPVFLDANGYGHRNAEYTTRWKELGMEQSGWNQSADGSFVSQAPLGIRGHPIDPLMPYQTPLARALPFVVATLLGGWLVFNRSMKAFK